MKKDEVTKSIPVIIYAQIERTKDKKKAIELEAKGFITAAGVYYGSWSFSEGGDKKS